VKTNFKKIESQDSNKKELETADKDSQEKPLTQEEFEEYVINSGAKGSFMVYRSNSKEDELGIDEL
tara:strand:+ start:1172 stop:1369 length:198 start_codon:yes stop_codon:yes gene_type:complete